MHLGRSASMSTAALEAAVPAAYALGALMLAGEAAVHIQQYVAIFHEVSWVGPLFLANAAACLVVIVGLAYTPTRRLAALAGVVISVVALGSLVVSYGQGLFGWREAGFRTPVALVTIAEVVAVLLLSAALVAPRGRGGVGPDRPQPRRSDFVPTDSTSGNPTTS
jgi:hypothetical protein